MSNLCVNKLKHAWSRNWLSIFLEIFVFFLAIIFSFDFLVIIKILPLDFLWANIVILTLFMVLFMLQRETQTEIEKSNFKHIFQEEIFNKDDFKMRRNYCFKSLTGVFFRSFISLIILILSYYCIIFLMAKNNIWQVVFFPLLIAFIIPLLTFWMRSFLKENKFLKEATQDVLKLHNISKAILESYKNENDTDINSLKNELTNLIFFRKNKYFNDSLTMFDSDQTIIWLEKIVSTTNRYFERFSNNKKNTWINFYMLLNFKTVNRPSMELSKKTKNAWANSFACNCRLEEKDNISSHKICFICKHVIEYEKYDGWILKNPNCWNAVSVQPKILGWTNKKEKLKVVHQKCQWKLLVMKKVEYRNRVRS